MMHVYFNLDTAHGTTGMKARHGMLLSRNQKCCRRPPIPMELNLKKEGASSCALLRDTVRSLLIPLAPRRIGLGTFFIMCTGSYASSRVTGHTSWRVSAWMYDFRLKVTWKWPYAGHELQKNGFWQTMILTSLTYFKGARFKVKHKAILGYRHRDPPCC